MILISILLLYLVILITSKIIGDFLVAKMKLETELGTTIIGFFVWLSALFIISQLVELSEISSTTLFGYFSVFTGLSIIIGLKNFKLTYKRSELVFIILYILFFIFLSSRYTLGESLGDNVYLFNLVTKNINADIINNFDLNNGFTLVSAGVGSVKESLAFYHFFAFVLHYYYKIIDLFYKGLVPAYVLNMWLANLLFYTFSGSFLVSMFRRMDIRQNWTKLIILLFCGLYIGTIYYNLTLPHFGITFMGLVISLILFLMYEYLIRPNISQIILIMLMGFSMVSLGTAGLIAFAYLSFSFIVVLLHKKDENSFLYGTLLLIPIIVYTYKIEEMIAIPNFLAILTFIPLLLITIHFIKSLKHFIMRWVWVILAVVWTFFIYVQIKVIPDYFQVVKTFPDIKENFDRVRDYFSFYSFNVSFRNLIHYAILSGLLLKRETRTLVLMLIIMVVFFMNPFVYPLLYKHLWFLYHRAYFSVFNIFTLGMGLYCIASFVDSLKINFRWMARVLLVVIVASFGLTSALTYENKIYIPSDDFDPIYKMDKNQVDILTKLYYEVEASEIINAKVVSQIYGTMMMVPNIYHYRFTVGDRRSWNPELEESFDPLYKIFFTPLFDGDDGPRFNAQYDETCNLFYTEKVDFILYDKRLHVYNDQDQNWIPIYRRARACAEIRYENDDYILFRYYW